MVSVEVKTRTEKVDVKNDLERRINLPAGCSVLSYVDNIEYGIKQLRNYLHEHPETEGVIGFYLVKGWGTREMFHRILPREKAEELKKNIELGFRYYTLNELLKEKLDIKKGKYIIEEGQIIDFNPNYSD